MRLPERWLHGASGQLGPLQWWRLRRAPAVPVTVRQVRGSGVFTAHGLLRADDAPDLRDSAVDPMHAVTRRLKGIASRATTLMGEQGGPTGPGELQAHLDYWTALNATVRGPLSRDDDATMLPAALPGIDASLISGHAHALNWQRA